MNVDKMTERVREALSDAFSRALRERNPSVETEHVLAALLEQNEGVVPALLAKAGVDVPKFSAQLHDAVAKLPASRARATSSRNSPAGLAARSCKRAKRRPS